MKKGYKYTLGVLTIMILLTLTIGTSYSYYTIDGKQENENSVVTSCFKIDFGSESGTINLADAYPISDAKGEALTPYTFTVTNTCTSDNSGYTAISYDVTLNTIAGETNNLAPYLKYKLDTQAAGKLSGRLDNTLNATLKTINYAGVNGSTIDTTYNLISGTLAPGASKTYSLRLWIDETATTDIAGYKFNGRVVVYAHT